MNVLRENFNQRFWWFLFAIVLLGCTSTGTGSGKRLSLLEAIEESAQKTAEELPRGSRVAIVAFASSNDNLSDYIMEELTGALFDRGIEVADRQNLAYVYNELNFQMTGAVSDDTAKSIGKFLAADMVITGQLTDLDGMFRYRTSAIHVETAVRTSVTRLDVQDDEAMRHIVTALANQQTATRAAKYGVSEDRTPQTAGTFLDRGILFASRGEYEKAIADFTEAIRLRPNMSAAYLLRGRSVYAGLSNVINASDNFGRITATLTEGQASTEKMRALEPAIADFTQAIRFNPHFADAYNHRGIAYTELGNYDQAIADFTQAISMDTHYASLYNNRGLAYHKKKDYDRAVADYTQTIRLNPNHAVAYSNRGVTFAEIGNYDRAIADYAQAIILDPNKANTYHNRAGMYFRMRDYDRAVTDYTQAIQLNPNLTGSYNDRGVAYFYSGDYDMAIADWETVLRLDPNHSAARQNIQKIRQMRGY